MIKVNQNVYRNVVDKNTVSAIPAAIGLAKGDLIVFNAAGSPVRFSAGNTSGKVLETDPTSDTGWKLGNGGGGGGGTASLTVTLVNNSGASILTGTIVVIDPEGGEREIRKAESTDEGTLFITSADSTGSGDSVECYCIPNTICNVLCTTDAVAVGDKLEVSATDGIAETGTKNSVGIALTAKASGSAGYVKVLLNCFPGSGTTNWTAGTTDLEEGVSTLQKDHFYFYYEAEEE